MALLTIEQDQRLRRTFPLRVHLLLANDAPLSDGVPSGSPHYQSSRHVRQAEG